jgi:predicted RNase H-like nuclease (RuvC/YqgF family)
MANDKTNDQSYEDSNKRLKRIIDNKKNESSALRKILKSLDKNVKHKNKKND